MIVKKTKGYHVVSKSGKNLGGPYKTREAAKIMLSVLLNYQRPKGENKKRRTTTKSTPRKNMRSRLIEMARNFDVSLLVEEKKG